MDHSSLDCVFVHSFWKNFLLDWLTCLIKLSPTLRRVLNRTNSFTISIHKLREIRIVMNQERKKDDVEYRQRHTTNGTLILKTQRLCQRISFFLSWRRHVSLDNMFFLGILCSFFGNCSSVFFLFLSLSIQLFYAGVSACTDQKKGFSIKYRTCTLTHWQIPRAVWRSWSVNTARWDDVSLAKPHQTNKKKTKKI